MSVPRFVLWAVGNGFFIPRPGARMGWELMGIGGGSEVDRLERRLLHLSMLADPLSPFSGGTVGGRQVMVRETVRAVQDEGYGIDVLTAGGDGSVERSALGHLARVVRLASAAADTPLGDRAPAWGREALEWIRSQGRHYQLMHSHHWMSGAVAQELRSALGVPWVHSPWAMPDMVQEEPAVAEAMESQLREADWVVVPYPSFADRVLEIAPEARVRVISPGVDVSTFFQREAGPVLKALGQKQRGLLTVVGQADDGVRALLRDWTDRRRAGVLPADVVLLVAGMDPPDGDAQAWQQLGVRFLGTLTHRNLARYYAAAAVTILPARHASLGMAALESMASGTPVVATAVAGQASVVVPGETGWLGPAEDTPALLDAALTLRQDVAAARALGAAGIAHVAQHYTRTGMARALADLYEEIAAVPRTAPSVASAVRP